MKIHGYVEGLRVCHIVIDGGHGYGTGWITPICGASQFGQEIKQSSEMGLCKWCEKGLEKRLAIEHGLSRKGRKNWRIYLMER